MKSLYIPDTETGADDSLTKIDENEMAMIPAVKTIHNGKGLLLLVIIAIPPMVAASKPFYYTKLWGSNARANHRFSSPLS
ncbi:hypothetical protein GCM10023310_67770 [Paenibacillus vulneris]